ncbi:hypothetical protein Tco_1050262 [Tanacetum coccineum]
MEGWKHKDLKSKDFDSIKELFDKAFKRVNMFVDVRTDLVEGSSKRAGEELEQENEEEVTIDVIPLAVKSPRIVNWKIHKEGKKSYYQRVRADGKSQMYMIFSHMLKSFDREDLEDLYKLVKARYGSTRPLEDLDLGRIVGIKSFLMLFEVIAALIDVNATQSNKLGGRTREKTIMKDQEHPKKCGETMTRAIIRAMVNKLPEESFSGVSEDKGDLEGIIDYLEPTLYDGFINPNDEAYKQRMDKLLGMPNTEPPLILKEEAEITRYNLGLEKFSQKLKS